MCHKGISKPEKKLLFLWSSVCKGMRSHSIDFEEVFSSIFSRNIIHTAAFLLSGGFLTFEEPYSSRREW